MRTAAATGTADPASGIARISFLATAATAAATRVGGTSIAEEAALTAAAAGHYDAIRQFAPALSHVGGAATAVTLMTGTAKAGAAPVEAARGRLASPAHEHVQRLPGRYRNRRLHQSAGARGTITAAGVATSAGATCDDRDLRYTGRHFEGL